MRVLKLVGLFLGYALAGFGGDYAVSLLAQEHTPANGVRVHVNDVKVERAVRVRTRVRASESCRYEAERSVRIDASASQQLFLEAGSGDLKVVGVAGLGEVRAVGRACASDEASLQDLQLTLEKRGDAVALTAHYPDIGWHGDGYARIDLTVEIPRGMSVDLDDSSGDLQVSGSGDLRIDDSSGGILVEDATGSVSIDDSSGEIDVSGVQGDLRIEDGSGSIDVRNVQGSVRLDDGSGGISVVGVGRDVMVDGDGSGSIEVRDVKGDFTVRHDGSGSIRYSGIQGTVDIPREKMEGYHRHGG